MSQQEKDERAAAPALRALLPERRLQGDERESMTP